MPNTVVYRIRRNLDTEMSGATQDDHAPEFRDSHEASQDQAEEASDDKDKARTEVNPILSTPFSFSSQDTEFDEETGEFESMKLMCPFCVPTRREPHKLPFEADNIYMHCVITCSETMRLLYALEQQCTLTSNLSLEEQSMHPSRG